LEFVAEFGEFASACHFGGEFFEGGFFAGLVQDVICPAYFGPRDFG
jgi:hypothetical protein